ncbi:MAG: hypothetical protein P1V35_10800, partial [Planctomycetota bacterium]|nr:hypothetical protein [Planctomycetota bacterium]
MLRITQILTLASLALVPQENQDGHRATGPQAHVVERQGMVMGAPWSLSIGGADRADALANSENVVRALAASEQRLSNWRPDSELSAWNRSKPGEPMP